MVMCSVVFGAPEMTPRVLGSSTDPFATTYPWQNLSAPFAVTSTWIPARSLGTCTWVRAPGTISVGFVAEQPEPLDTADAAIATTLIASAFELRVRIAPPQK